MHRALNEAIEAEHSETSRKLAAGDAKRVCPRGGDTGSAIANECVRWPALPQQQQVSDDEQTDDPAAAQPAVAAA